MAAQGERDEARLLPAVIYGWFTVGFEMAISNQARERQVLTVLCCGPVEAIAGSTLEEPEAF
jgi:hypothetical protein